MPGCDHRTLYMHVMKLTSPAPQQDEALRAILPHVWCRGSALLDSQELHNQRARQKEIEELMPELQAIEASLTRELKAERERTQALEDLRLGRSAFRTRFRRHAMNLLRVHWSEGSVAVGLGVSAGW